MKRISFLVEDDDKAAMFIADAEETPGAIVYIAEDGGDHQLEVQDLKIEDVDGPAKLLDITRVIVVKQRVPLNGEYYPNMTNGEAEDHEQNKTTSDILDEACAAADVEAFSHITVLDG